MKRQCALNVQDYQKLSKSKRFSPSPIKRYTSSRVNVYNDNKENIGSASGMAVQNLSSQLAKVSHSQLPKLTQKKHKRLPLQQSQIYQQLQNNMSLVPNTPPKQHKSDEFFAQAESKVLASHNLDERQMEFENKSDSSSLKKRLEKLGRKQLESDQKVERLTIPEDPIADLALPPMVAESKEESSEHKEEESPVSIKKLEKKESDSPMMEGTYHSEASLHQSLHQYSGRWTQEEHQKFIDGLKFFGKDWRRIEEYIGSRSCAQIRSHAQKYFNRIQREVEKRNVESREPVSSMEPLVTLAELMPKPKRQQLEKKPSVEAKELPMVQLQQTVTPLKAQTNDQIQQIHETLSKITEEEFLLGLRTLIQQREVVCLDVMLKTVTFEQACERLIKITNRFHQLAMQALQASKFETCNRMIDERNLTQFTCILFSKQVTIAPPSESMEGQEIIQHVKVVPVGRSDSQHSGGGSLKDSNSSLQYPLTQETADMMMAKTSPNVDLNKSAFKRFETSKRL